METINWKNVVEDRKEDLLNDIERLLRINSVKGDPVDGAPLGEGPKQAIDEIKKMGYEAGFKVNDYGPLVTRIDWGETGEPFGVLGHVDVVPVGTGWDSNPFEPTYKDGKLIARGSLDDKGPLVCAFFAMKLLKERGYIPKRKLQLIVGSDEETNWECLNYYKTIEKLPREGFVPDAYFPVVNGEKGIIHFTIEEGKDDSQTGTYYLVEFKSGTKENMVPGLAEARLKGGSESDIADSFQRFLVENPNVSGQVDQNDEELKITLYGKSAHGSTPSKGVNAATYLAKFLSQHPVKNGKSFLNHMGESFHETTDGKNLGINHQSEIGELTFNVGIANYDCSSGGRIVTDIRFPFSQSSSEIKSHLEEYFEGEDLHIVVKKDPHFVSPDTKLVKTLLKIYESQTGDKGYTKVIGGSTYASLLSEGVAFGALFPSTEDTMHQANEFIPVNDLVLITAIYAQALFELICKAE